VFIAYYFSDNFMSDKDESIYKVIELVGSSKHSWEEAAQNAVEKASKTLRNLRIVTIQEQDAKIENGKITQFRVRVKLSFKFEA
jgi:dodecin